MDINEITTQAGILTGIFAGAVVTGLLGYLRKPQAPVARPGDPVIAGIGMAYGEKEQTERLIAVQTRIAEALEVLADRKTDQMADIHRALLERLDAQERREEQEEPRPRRHPRTRPR